MSSTFAMLLCEKKGGKPHCALLPVVLSTEDWRISAFLFFLWERKPKVESNLIFIFVNRDFKVVGCVRWQYWCITMEGTPLFILHVSGHCKACQHLTYITHCEYVWRLCRRYSNLLGAVWSGFWTPMGPRFSVSAQTDPVAHPPYCTIGTRVKRPGLERWPSTPF